MGKSVFDAAGVPDPRKGARRSIFDVAGQDVPSQPVPEPRGLLRAAGSVPVDGVRQNVAPESWAVGSDFVQAANRLRDERLSDPEAAERDRVFLGTPESGPPAPIGDAATARAYLERVQVERGERSMDEESEQRRFDAENGGMVRAMRAAQSASLGLPRLMTDAGTQQQFDTAAERQREGEGMLTRLAVDAVPGILTMAPVAAAGGVKALVGVGAVQGAAMSPEGERLSGAVKGGVQMGTMGAVAGPLTRLFGGVSPGSLRTIAAEGASNVVGGMLGRGVVGDSPADQEGMASDLILGMAMALTRLPAQMRERRLAEARAKAQGELDARVLADVERRMAEIDARNASEAGERALAEQMRRDVPKAALPAGSPQGRPGLPPGEGPAVIRVDAEGRSLAGEADLPAGTMPARPQGLPQGAIQGGPGPEPKSWRRAVEAFQRAPGGLLAARLFARGQFTGQNMADLRNTAALVGVDLAGVKSKAEIVDRLVKSAEGRRPPTLSVEQAGEVKRRVVEAGLATEEQVASPERVEVAREAQAAGASPEQVARLVQAMPPEARPDGTVAAGYLPSAEALRQGLIEPAAVPAVKAARGLGIEPVTSGTTPLGDGFAVGVDAAGNLRRVEAAAKSPAAVRGEEAMARGEPPDAWIAGTAKRLEQEGFTGNPAAEAVRLWNEQGRMSSGATLPSRAPPTLPPPAAHDAPAPGRTPAEAQALGEGLKKYGPQKPGAKGGPRLGAAIGGVDPTTALKAADLPRNILGLPGRLLNKPIAKGFDMLGTMLGRYASRIPGASRVSDWWRVARRTQDVFATDSAGREAGAVRTEGVLKRVAGKVSGPEAEAVAFDYITNPNRPNARARALSSLGGDAVKALDEALDIRDSNQRYIEQHELVGAEARRVYGAKEGERGAYLRTEYTGVEDEVLDHLMRLSGRGAKLPKNELKRDRWIVTWGKDSYRKFDTEAEAVAFRKNLRSEAREQVEAKKDQARRGQPVGGEPGTNAEIIPPLSPEARKAMGEVVDPAVVLARTIALQDLKITRHKTLLALRADSLPGDTPLKQVPQRFLRRDAALGKDAPALIPDDPRYGPLRGRIVDRHVYNEAVGRFGEIEAIDKVFDVLERMTMLWKSGKTIYNPGSQAGNAMGNVAFTELAGVSPSRPSDLPHFRDAWRIATAEPGTPEHALLIEFTRRGFGASASIDSDLRGSLRAAMDARSGGDETFLRRAGRIIARAPHKSWAMIDAVPKMAAALKVLRNGGTLDDATKVVRAGFPDYSRSWAGLIVNSRTRMARVTKATLSPPFVNFTSEAVRILAGAAKNKAGSLAAGLVTLKMLGDLSRRAAGISDEEAEKAMALAPDWMRAGSLAAPFWWDRDEKGNVQIVDLRYVLPLSQEAGDLIGDDDARRSGWSIVNNPILAPLVDVGLNVDRFFGERLTKPGHSKDEEREQKARYLFDAYMPSVLTKVTPFSRRPGSTYRALTGTPDRYGQVPEVSTALLGDFGGVRVRPIDPQVEQARRETSIVARLNQMKDALRESARKGDEDEMARIVEALAELEAEYEALERATR